ncbi:pre-peptidase C-terminal domain-containing protein [Kurthia gibsonii]|uniref:pre-peptidase C-terminal domain-containing protein n=1 Tax=Kurthia gibsonii TaxID=33946 RepID=UPI002DB9A8F5|nr:pre-peptidase C-terminal domain-containing protein [Kurthia gibsonii]MEB7773230.1 hypothetical protein [Kurthia gibsonii]
MKKFFFTCFIAFALYFIVANPQAQAADYPVIQSGQTIEGTLAEDDRVLYQVNVTKPGYVKFQGTSYSRDLYLSLLDENHNKIVGLHDSFSNATATAPVTRTTGEYVEPGIYYISAYNNGWHSEDFKYRFTMTVVDSKTTEIEPNNGSELAMAIKPTQKPVTAQLSWNDSTDYYKVKLDQAGLLNIKMTAYMDRMYVQVFDSDLYEVEGWSDYYGGSELSGKVKQGGYYLEKGTYYIKVSQWNSYTGKYKIETKFSKTSNNEKEPNNGLEQAQKIKPNVQSVTGLISWNDSSDFYKVDVSKTGVLNVHMTVYQSMEIKIYDRDGDTLLDRWIFKSSNTSSDKWSTSLNVKKGTYYIQIYGSTGLYKLNVKVPEMLPKSPKAKATKTKVTGTTYANSKVTVKIGSKKYTGKSNSKGAFSIKIPTQKVKTKVYVSVTTGAGTSKTTKVQVK